VVDPHHRLVDEVGEEIEDRERRRSSTATASAASSVKSDITASRRATACSSGSRRS
jgi:hypothetical protein